MAAAPPLPPDVGTPEDAPPNPAPQGWVPPVPIPRAPLTAPPGSSLANLMGDPMPQDVLGAQDSASWLGQLLKTYMQRRVAEAGQMTQGPFHAPGAIDQAAGGGMGAMGTVINPENRYFQWLMANDPLFAGALQKMKGGVEYADQVTKQGVRALNRKGASGITTMLKPESIAQAAALPEGLPSSFMPVRGNPITPSELKSLAERTRTDPAASFQHINPSGANETDTPVTLYHEGYHSIYGNKGTEQVPNISNDRAFDLMARVLNRAGLSHEQAVPLLHHYMLDPQHGLVEALAQFRNAKRLGNVPSTLQSLTP